MGISITESQSSWSLSLIAMPEADVVTFSFPDNTALTDHQPEVSATIHIIQRIPGNIPNQNCLVPLLLTYISILTWKEKCETDKDKFCLFCLSRVGTGYSQMRLTTIKKVKDWRNVTFGNICPSPKVWVRFWAPEKLPLLSYFHLIWSPKRSIGNRMKSAILWIVMQS